MSGRPLKAVEVRLEGTRFVDCGTARESREDREDTTRSRTALAIFHRRIEGLKAETLAVRQEMARLRESVAARLEESRAEGHLAGLAEGRGQAEAELEEAFRLLAGQERDFRRAAADYHARADRELVRLARWMAEAVLRRELPLDGEALARRVRDLLEECLDQQVVRLHLHPGERRRLLGEGLEERQPRLAELVRSLAGRLEWVEAADVPPGACRVELHDGLLEASPPAMLEHLEQELIRACQGGGA
jgi:flagellar biosynthesis/type III secretory pathway protein FliH